MPSHVVIISGLPAAGKSSLAARLATELGLPLVPRDRLRRYVFEPLLPVREAHAQIPEMTGRLVVETLRMLARAGVPAVLDGNFNTPEHAEPLRVLLRDERLAASEICLWGEVEVLRERFINRADPPLTDDLRPYFERVLHRPHEAVLSDDGSVMHVDTTDLSTLERDVPNLVGWLRTRLVLSSEAAPGIRP